MYNWNPLVATNFLNKSNVQQVCFNVKQQPGAADNMLLLWFCRKTNPILKEHLDFLKGFYFNIQKTEKTPHTSRMCVWTFLSHDSHL